MRLTQPQGEVLSVELRLGLWLWKFSCRVVSWNIHPYTNYHCKWVNGETKWQRRCELRMLQTVLQNYLKTNWCPSCLLCISLPSYYAGMHLSGLHAHFQP